MRWPSVLWCCVLMASLLSLGWRSELYPEDWTPGFAVGDRFLHDFSYAGYHAGEQPVPDNPPGPTVDVTAPPYGADNSGATDVTEVLQQAIDAVGEAGGGVVFLPAGTYKISTGERFGLHIGHSRVVLRGAGPAQTHIFNDTTMMRDKKVIMVQPERDRTANWFWRSSDQRLLTADVISPTFTIEVGDTIGYDVGDWIVVRGDATAEFIADHGMTGWWSPAEDLGSIIYRQIRAIDRTAGRITLDAPTRYPILVRDNAKITHIPPHLEEIGIENLSIGNHENGNSGWDTNDYASEGTGAYEVHASFAIHINHVVNAWVRNVHTYRPPVNSQDVHVLSNCLRVDNSRFLTIEDCDFRRPQYRGAGGNGYLYTLVGSDTLVKNCHAETGRHDYSHSFMQATGNVIVDSTSKNATLPVDFHQRLSTANLIDNLTMEGNFVEAAFRDCCTHGQSASQNVIWRTQGLSYRLDMWPWEWNVVTSQQFGHGYVIGTYGAATIVKNPGGFNTEPRDHVEGVGTGETLEPRSLYYDQLARRLGLPTQADGGPPTSDGGPLQPDAAPTADGAGPMDGGPPGDASIGRADERTGDEGTGQETASAGDRGVVAGPPPSRDVDGGSACSSVPASGWLLGAGAALLWQTGRRRRRWGRTT